LWGSATSSHQVEGDNTNNDWWEWEQSGHTQPSGKACDHYNRFRDDFRLAKELGHNTHRFSIEWSRVEKEEGVWDQAEWDHYKAVVDELIKLDIEPIVSLNHFTLPLWLSRKDSWLNNDIVPLFGRYAVKAIEELGSRVRYWIAMNEPNILALLGYVEGKWPPCKRSLPEGLKVLKNMRKSHIEAYGLMHEKAREEPGIKPPQIGIAKAVTAFHPCRHSSRLDRLSTYLRGKFHNHVFISSSKKSLDFIGLNYYFRQFIHHARPFIRNPIGEVCSYTHHKNAGKLTDMGWEIYPEGLYEVIQSFIRYKLPILITENGLATTDDALRQRYIRDHLKQLLRSIEEGAPVKGYLHWSLLDNFEWADGYRPRFGLINVDYATQKRTVTDAARYYSSIIRTGRIPD